MQQGPGYTEIAEVSEKKKKKTSIIAYCCRHVVHVYPLFYKRQNTCCLEREKKLPIEDKHTETNCEIHLIPTAVIKTGRWIHPDTNHTHLSQRVTLQQPIGI